MKFGFLCVLAAGASIGLAQSATAAVITSLPGGVDQVMPALDYMGPDPQTFGSGVTWVSSYTVLDGFDDFSVFGWVSGYGFTPNDQWSGTPMAGTNHRTASMYFKFATPIAAFLAELNWAREDYRVQGVEVFLRAYDGSDSLLESLQLADGASDLVSPGYYGFQRGSADIAYIELVGGYVGARDLSTSSVGVGVPEPAIWMLMICGFGGTGAMLRRRRAAVATG